MVKTAQTQQGRPPRHVYEVTDVGRELLHEMLTELPPENAGDEAEFLSRVAQFALLEPRERLGVLDARNAAVLARLTHLHSLQEAARDEEWGSLVTKELIRRCEAEQSWLQHLRTLAEADT